MKNINKLAGVCLKWAKIIFPIITIMLLIVLYNMGSEFKFIGIIISTFIPFIFSVIIAWVFHPLVTKLETKYKIPRTLSATLVIILLALMLVGIFVLVIPVLVAQVYNFAVLVSDNTDAITKFFVDLANYIPIENFDEIIADFFNDLESQTSSFLLDVVKQAGDVLTSTISILSSIATNLILLLMTFMVALYLLIDFNNVRAKLYSVVPERLKSDIQFLNKEANIVIVGYIRGLLLESLIIFILSYVAFLILGIEGSVGFALIIGITNIIPYIGPFIGAVPVGAYALFQSFNLFLVIAVIILIIQQFDSLVLKPKVFGKTNAIHPALVIIAFLLFGQLYGIIGVVFAVPFTGLVIVLAKFIYRKLIVKYPHILK